MSQPIYYYQPRRRGTFIGLAFFLGSLGVHNFYAGHFDRAIVQFILTCTLIGIPINFFWILIEICFKTKDSNGIEMV